MGGGLIVGLPLLFTMEMWFHAFLLPSWKIIVLLAVAFVIVIGYNAVSGFRRERSWGDLLVDSVETMGIAAVVSLAAMVILGRIDLDTDLRDAAGKVALEMIPVAFGVSLAGTQLASPGGGDDEDSRDRGSAAVHGVPGPFARLFIAGGGAVLFALNVAPTEEPMLLGVEAETWQLLAALVASLLVTYAIVFYAEFRGSAVGRAARSPLAHPVGETIAAYVVSLLVSLMLLWAFGRTDGTAPAQIVAQAVMLSVVASFGAALGRLLIGGGEQEEA
jgi:putative integral membrane protein (TIGR02587 family)